MIRNLRAASMVEYVVLAVLLIALVGGALLALNDAIRARLTNVYTDIGS
jgi:Flp pilus assembly pilin Flp